MPDEPETHSPEPETPTWWEEVFERVREWLRPIVDPVPVPVPVPARRR